MFTKKGITVLMVVFLFLSGYAVAEKMGVQQIQEKKTVTIKGNEKKKPDTELTHPDKTPYVSPGYRDNSQPEEAGESFLIPPKTNIGNEDPEASSGNVNIQAGTQLGKDILTTYHSLSQFDKNYINPVLASHSNGNYYVAYQLPSSGGDWYIRVDYSEDGGATWMEGHYVYKNLYQMTNPSIAVTANEVIIAYVVDNGTDDPFVEVANAPLDFSSNFVAHSVLHYTPNEAKPHVWTDLHTYPTSNSVYLTCEWWVDVATNNVNTNFQRSADDGDTWKDLDCISGNTNPDKWIDPEGCFGNNTHYLYVVNYNDTDDTIYFNYSTDWGVTWTMEQAITTLTYSPTNLVDPSIAESTYTSSDNVLIVYTSGSSGGDDDINYIYSANHGSSWSGPFTYGQTTSYEEAASIHANQGGNNFHITYTKGNAVYYMRRPQTLAYWDVYPYQFNRGGLPSVGYPLKGITSNWEYDFPTIVWSDYYYNPLSYYRPFSNRLYPDDLLGTWTGQGVYFRTELGNWTELATPADMIAAGDLDGDSTDDLLGIWPSQGGVWVRKSNGGGWSKLSSTATHIYAGDMDTDSLDELLGSWAGQGVFYLDSIGGTWTKMASAATKIAAGDIDNDGTDDLLGIWPSQGGVWVKYSSTSTWSKLSSTADFISAGDMNGDGHDDLLGTWTGQGVYYRNSKTGAWVQLATPADMIATGDLDGDGTDDLIGVWPSQGGVWVKYSSTSTWAKLGTTPTYIFAGMMRGGANTWNAQAGSGFEPLTQEFKQGPGFTPFDDLSDKGPGGFSFLFKSEANLIPQGSKINAAGPGELGFYCTKQKNLVPKETDEADKISKGKIKK